jgi:hypothetical protein
MSCVLRCLQVPVTTMNALLERWGLGQAVPPPPEEQEYFLDMPYAALMYVVDRGSAQDVLRRLEGMAR